MAIQTYKNHARYVLAFHGILMPLLLITAVGAVRYFYISVLNHDALYPPSLLLLLSVGAILLAFLSRIFALKAQDRAIRAEENLRHFALTGKLLDARLTLLQVIALRFASDGEFVALARRAAEENMTPDAIKRAVAQWRADYHRV